MSKRPSEYNSPPVKHIKSSSGLDQEDQNGNQVTSQDSGYSGSQGNVVQPMDLEEYIKQGSKADVRGSEYEGSQGQDVQPMDLDDDDEQGSDVMDGSSPSKGNIPDILGIRVDEESNQQPHAEMLKGSDEKRRYNFAENLLHCTVAIGSGAASKQKKEKKKRKKEGLDDKDAENPQDLILMNACALLNSGGGVLVIKSADSQTLSQNMVDNFWKTIEPKLKGLLKSSLTYNDIFDLKVDFDEIFLFITAPQHFCTVEYNVFVPGDVGVYEANYDQTVELLQKETAQGKKRKSLSVDVPLKDLPKVPRTFRNKEELGLIESKQVQLKHFRSETYLDSNNRTQCQGISKQISAFANASGGVILLGVTDEREVCGLNINEKNSKRNIEERVTAIVEKMALCCNFTLQRKVHWDVDFIPVSDTESKAVVVICVAGMGTSGGVFTKCPRSFELRSDDDGRKVPHLLNFEEWKKGMLSGLELRSNSKATEAMISKFHKLNISKGYLLTVKGDVQKIRDTFFTVEDGFPVTPRGFESNLPQEAQDVIKEVQKKCSRDRNRGLIVASHSWPNNSEASPMKDIICDLLIVSRNLGGLHLITLCRGGDGDGDDDDDDEKFLEYSREVANSIKTSLVRDGACTQKFYVVPHVVPCTGTKRELVFLRDNRYPASYGLDVYRGKLNEVLKALVIILATVPSALSNKLGVSIMNLLTKEQFQLVHQQIEINRELWIKGAAGTGKTLVAVEFMRELKRREKLEKEEILYVCENVGITNQIRRADVCQCVTRKYFMTYQFPEVKHIVLDEVQSFRAKDGDWLSEARSIVQRSSECEDVLVSDASLSPDQDLDSSIMSAPISHLGMNRDRDEGQGYLWLFIDNEQINTRFATGIPPKNKQHPSFTLKKVIRNSKRIFDYGKKFISRDLDLEIGHDFEGEEVTKIYYAKGSQLVSLKNVLESLFEKGYSKGEIAILFEKEDSKPDDLSSKLKLEPRLNFVDAEENHEPFVLVSTFRKYSGLERPVIILVDVGYSSLRNSYNCNVRASMYCAVTRAMVKLISLEEKQ